jgi:hypothetical protein
MILPQDDIPASNEITYGDRLGLAKIPRASTKALAAINYNTRKLEGAVLKQHGDVASGEYTFRDQVTFEGGVAQEQATIQDATIIRADVVEQSVGEQTVEEETVGNLTVTEKAVIQEIDAETGEIEDLTVGRYHRKMDKRFVTVPSGELVEISMDFSPEVVEYKAVHGPTSKPKATSIGEVDIYGHSSFLVPSGDVDEFIGIGFPQKNHFQLMRIEIDETVVRLTSVKERASFIIKTSRY